MQQTSVCRSRNYSITSSAQPSSGTGIVRPSALAVVTLMISSTFIDCCAASYPGNDLIARRVLSLCCADFSGDPSKRGSRDAYPFLPTPAKSLRYENILENQGVRFSVLESYFRVRSPLAPAMQSVSTGMRRKVELRLQRRPAQRHTSAPRSAEFSRLSMLRAHTRLVDCCYSQSKLMTKIPETLHEFHKPVGKLSISAPPGT